MLSISSFNALLKTLEEPPPHVKFLLATTDPQRLPVTVLSRCLQFNLKRLTPRMIQERLEHICVAEEISFDSGALASIARAADGSLRDALSLLDQAIAFCGGQVAAPNVAVMLGTIDRDHVARLLRLLADSDAAGIIDAVAEIDEKFPDYSRLLEDLARALQQVAVFQVVGRLNVDDESSEDVIEELAGSIEPADVQLYYQIAITGRRDLDLAPDPRSGAEMTLLRMLAFRPAGSVSGRGAEPGERAKTGRNRGKAAQKDARQEMAAASTTEPDPDGFDWVRAVPNLGLKGAALMLASNCAFDRRDGDTLRFGLDPRSESLLTKERKDAIAESLAAYFGSRVRVEILVKEHVAETPTQEQVRIADERLDAARASLEADPNVQTLKNMFGAELKPDSIELLNSPRSD